MDMGGWDVIYASSVSRLNAVLAQSRPQLLASFSYSDQTGVEFSGDFGPWQIVSGGSANRINVQVPITQGTLSGPGLASAVSLEGVGPVLNIALALVEGASANTLDLKFDIQVSDNSPGPAAEGQVIVANPDVSGLLAQRDPTGVAASMLRANLPECFVANADKISFVFASVFMDPQNATWMKPKATGISYFGSTDGSLQAVAIKTITQSPWGPDGLSTAVDPSLLGGGGNLFFALSQAAFMENVLLPSVPKAIGNGVSADTFKFNGPNHPDEQNACSITNAKNFSTPPVEHEGTHYYPEITGFRINISDNQITTIANGQFDVTGLAGASVSFDNLKVVNELTFDQSTQALKFQLVSRQSPSVDKHIPWEYELMPGISLVIGGVILLVVELVVNAVDSAVQSALTGEGNLSVVILPLDIAVWTGLSGINVSKAGLEQSLVMSGQGAGVTP